MYYDDKPTFPLCISQLVHDEGGCYLTDDRFVSLSGVKIFCPKNQRRDIEKLFRNTFDPLWLKARRYVDLTQGTCPQEEYDVWPYHISAKEEYGIFIAINSLVLQCRGGDWYHPDELGERALNKVFAVLKERYPSIKYYGFLCDYYSDMRCGFWTDFYLEYNITKDEKTYDFIGEYISGIFQYESFIRVLKRIMEDYLYEDDDFYELIDFYYSFKEFMSTESYEKAINLVLWLAGRRDKYRSKRDDSELLTVKVQSHIDRLKNSEIISRFEEQEDFNEKNDFERWHGIMKTHIDKYLTGVAPKAVSDAWKYEDELDKLGYLPDEVHGEIAWDYLPRVHKKASEGDKKALSVLDKLEKLENSQLL